MSAQATMAATILTMSNPSPKSTLSQYSKDPRTQYKDGRLRL